MPSRTPGLVLFALLLFLHCAGDPEVVHEHASMTEADPAGSVRYIGRFDDAQADAIRLSWSGSGVALVFDGTGARATMRGGRYFTVVVDGDVQAEPLSVSDDGGVYDLVSDLPEGEHTVEVTRRTSAELGPTVLGAVEVDGHLLQAPVPDRQIEVISDSWATGYGVEGPDAHCGYSPETENASVAWSAIAARAVGAELSNVSYNGKGLALGDAPMLALYDRVIATEPESTGTIRPADVVFVAMGGNDLVEGELPAAFVSAYASLLEKIRGHHPDALIACVLPRLPDAGETARTHAAIDAAIARRAEAGETRIRRADIELPDLVDFGCDHHPGKQTHVQMARKAVAFLQAELDW